MDATRRQLRSRISKGALVGLPWGGPPSLLLRRCRMLVRPMECLWEDVLHLHECVPPQGTKKGVASPQQQAGCNSGGSGGSGAEAKWKQLQADQAWRACCDTKQHRSVQCKGSSERQQLSRPAPLANAPLVGRGNRIAGLNGSEIRLWKGGIACKAIGSRRRLPPVAASLAAPNPSHEAPGPGPASRRWSNPQLSSSLRLWHACDRPQAPAGAASSGGSMGWEGVQPPSEPAGYNPNDKFGECQLMGVAQRRGGSPTAPCCPSARRLGAALGLGSRALAGGPRVGRAAGPQHSGRRQQRTKRSSPLATPSLRAADPVVYYKHREARVAEEYVKVAEAKVGAVPLCQAAECAGLSPPLVLPAPCCCGSAGRSACLPLTPPAPYCLVAADPPAAEEVLQGVGGELPAELPRAGAGAAASRVV